MLYDGLFVLENDEPFIVYGNLAGRVKFADDLSEMRVQLRPEAYWHDRAPISAKDVKFTFDHVLNKSGSGIGSVLSIFESVEILGPYEVLFRFRRISGLNGIRLRVRPST